MQWFTRQIASHTCSAVALLARDINFDAIRFENVDNGLARLYRKTLTGSGQLYVEWYLGRFGRTAQDCCWRRGSGKAFAM